VLPLALLQPDGGGIRLLGICLAVFVAVQAIEGLVAHPAHHGQADRPPPGAIIFAVFFWGEAFGGILGMLLARALTACVVTAWRLVRRKYLPMSDRPAPASCAVCGADLPPECAGLSGVRRGRANGLAVEVFIWQVQPVGGIGFAASPFARPRRTPGQACAFRGSPLPQRRNWRAPGGRSWGKNTCGARVARPSRHRR